MDVRPLLLSLSFASGGELALSPDLDSACAEAVAALREAMLSLPDPGAEAWTVRAEDSDDETLAEAKRGILTALAAAGVPVGGSGREGALLEVGHHRLGDREAISLRGVKPPTETILAPFVRKTWVRHLPLPSKNEGGIVVKGESDFEASEERAAASAVADGAGCLRAALAACGLSARALARFLPDGEAARRFLVDRFARREERAGGGIWRAQALFRVGKEEMSALSREISRLEVGERGARRKTVVALGGIGLALFLGHLWLDFATRGHFTRWLRLLALGAFAASAGILR